jgi:opacity protein-like surface antigen
VNYGAQRTRQEFLSSVVTPAGRFGAFNHLNQHEFSAAYVFRASSGKKITPFGFAGAGILLFDPIQSGNSSAKFEFIYGAGADFQMNEKLFFRAMYRGQAYRIPGIGHLFGPYVTGFAHVIQPTLGVGFHF